MRTTINKESIELSKEQLASNLLEFLRDEPQDLTGSKNGCNKGFCGACTILIDEKPEQACTKTVNDIVDRSVTTIEGMQRDDGSLHPLQQAFIDSGAIQCGFCTPGMVLRAHGLLLKNHRPSRSDIRRAISPNLCRCTGYQQIVDAIEAASVHYRQRHDAREKAQ